MHSRRLVIVLAASLAAFGILAACSSKTASGPVTTDDVSLGDLNSPVTVIEYASVACPYCAKFNNEVFPDFKKKFIDTKQIHYVSREMLTHNGPLSAAGFLLARCAGKDKYFEVIDAIYHARDDMEKSGQYNAGLLKIAKSVGMSEEQFDACTQDPKAIEALQARVQKYMTVDGVTSTPTFIINGKPLNTPDLPTIADFDKAIAEARAKPAAPAAAAAPAATAATAPAATPPAKK